MIIFRGLLFKPLHNIEEMSILLCQALHIKLTKRLLCKELEEHPDFPSLGAVKDVFGKFNISSIALKLEDKSNIEKIEGCFLAQIIDIKNNSNLFAIIYSQDEDKLNWYNPIKKKKELIDRDVFLDLFTGYIFYANPDKNSGDREYLYTRKKENQSNMFSILLSVSIFSYLLFSLFLIKTNFVKIYFVVFILFLLLGGVITALMLLYEYDKNSPTLRKICNSSRRVNCLAVLSSKGSKIWGVPWTVIGFSYYLGLLFSLLINSFSTNNFVTVSYFNLLSLPYIIYSVYYQKFIIKQWCILCLLVQFINLALFILSVLAGSFSDSFKFDIFSTFSIFGSFIFSFGVAYLLWLYIQGMKDNKDSSNLLKKLKYNRDVFLSLLKNERKIEGITNDFGVILGNPNGSIHIVKVCNPYCYYCSLSHPILSQLVKSNDEIKLQIIFFEDPTSEEYKNTPIETFLSSYYEDKDMESILSDWYNNDNKNLEEFIRLHPIREDHSSKNKSNAISMFDFCVKNKISYTPSIFINGYELPEIYNFSDLLYFFIN